MRSISRRRTLPDSGRRVGYHDNGILGVGHAQTRQWQASRGSDPRRGVDFGNKADLSWAEMQSLFVLGKTIEDGDAKPPDPSASAAIGSGVANRRQLVDRSAAGFRRIDLTRRFPLRWSVSKRGFVNRRQLIASASPRGRKRGGEARAQRCRRPHRFRGYTLMEIATVLAILSILVSVALPSSTAAA